MKIQSTESWKLQSSSWQQNNHFQPQAQRQDLSASIWPPYVMHASVATSCTTISAKHSFGQIFLPACLTVRSIIIRFYEYCLLLSQAFLPNICLLPRALCPKLVFHWLFEERKQDCKKSYALRAEVSLIDWIILCLS
jgi:hypothetical protein